MRTKGLVDRTPGRYIRALIFRFSETAGVYAGVPESDLSNGFLSQIVPLIPKLRAYAILLTHSTAEADDLVQDTLLRAWRFRDGFSEGTNLKAWLFRILRNQFVSRAQVDRHITEDVDGQHAARLVSEPDQEFNLRYKELLAGLRLLSDDTRQALLLTTGSGFTYAEAARLCDCPVGTMKSRVNRAREFLANYVDADLSQRERPSPGGKAPASNTGEFA